MHLKAAAGFLSAALAASCLAARPEPARAIGNLVNGDFEQPNFNNNTPGGTPSFTIIDASTVPGWQTTASDNAIELWDSGFLGVPAFSGEQFAEINAREAAELFQQVSGIQAGTTVGFQFAHRGRQGDDTVRLTIVDLGTDNSVGGGNDTTLFSNEYTTGNSAWSFYQGGGLIAQGNAIRFGWEAVSSTGGSDSFGNFLDAAAFGVGIPVPAPLPLLAPGLLLGTLLKARRRYRDLGKSSNT